MSFEEEDLELEYVKDADKYSKIGTEIVNKLRTGHRTLKTFPTNTSDVKYQDLLSIYKNNQFYYVQVLIKETKLTQEQIADINTLERTFISIKERLATDANKKQKLDRDQREADKLIFGYSFYCHRLLRDYIDPNFTLPL